MKLSFPAKLGGAVFILTVLGLTLYIFHSQPLPDPKRIPSFESSLVGLKAASAPPKPVSSPRP